jgi:hypothetical protein
LSLVVVTYYWGAQLSFVVPVVFKHNYRLVFSKTTGTTEDNISSQVNLFTVTAK